MSQLGRFHEMLYLVNDSRVMQNGFQHRKSNKHLYYRQGVVVEVLVVAGVVSGVVSGVAAVGVVAGAAFGAGIVFVVVIGACTLERCWLLTGAAGFCGVAMSCMMPNPPVVLRPTVRRTSNNCMSFSLSF